MHKSHCSGSNFSWELYNMEDYWQNLWHLDLSTCSWTYWLLWWYYLKVFHLSTTNDCCTYFYNLFVWGKFSSQYISVYFRLCQDIVLLKSEVAELLLPNVMVNLAGKKDLDVDLCKLISSQVGLHAISYWWWSSLVAI